MIGMSAEIAVAEKESIVASVSFLFGEAVGEIRTDVLGPAVIAVGRLLFDAGGVLQHKIYLP